jgi:hypothetical protein
MDFFDRNKNNLRENYLPFGCNNRIKSAFKGIINGNLDYEKNS